MHLIDSIRGIGEQITLYYHQLLIRKYTLQRKKIKYYLQGIFVWRIMTGSVLNKIIDKVKQQKSMKQVRNRTLANPILLQEIVYNYREERTDQSSQPSFLKLSAKHSQEFNILKENNLFEQMQNRLDHLQNKHQQQLAKILKTMQRKGYAKKRKEIQVYGDKLVQQDREKIAYRELKMEKYEKNNELQLGNFQMDQHRNYVNNTPLCIRPPQFKDSSIVSQTSFILSECSEKEVILKNSSTSFKYNESLSRSQFKLINSQQSRVSERKQSQTMSRTKRKTTLSSNKQQTKRSRVYESILSQYSTAKLLAMQKSVI